MFGTSSVGLGQDVERLSGRLGGGLGDMCGKC